MREYADEVARRVRDALGERLLGVWLVGSAALGDYDPRRSDVDVQAVATGRIPVAERQELTARLAHEALPNPARGLEFVLYAAGDLAAPGGPRFQLNLNTGARMAYDVAYDPDDVPGFWFTIDLDIARQRGVPLLGPPAPAVLPPLPRDLVAAAALQGLDWHARSLADGAPVLLNACRSWAWATDGRWRSKGESAAWAMTRLPDPAPVAAALRLRDGEPAEPPTSGQVAEVLTAARTALQAVRG